MGLSRVTGEEGELKWGYRRAATVRAWSLTKGDDNVWTLTGTVSDLDDFALSQPALKFVTPNGWRFPITELQTQDASLRARLGPLEKTHGTATVCHA